MLRFFSNSGTIDSTERELYRKSINKYNELNDKVSADLKYVLGAMSLIFSDLQLTNRQLCKQIEQQGDSIKDDYEKLLCKKEKITSKLNLYKKIDELLDSYPSLSDSAHIPIKEKTHLIEEIINKINEHHSLLLLLVEEFLESTNVEDQAIKSRLLPLK